MLECQKAENQKNESQKPEIQKSSNRGPDKKGSEQMRQKASEPRKRQWTSDEPVESQRSVSQEEQKNFQITEVCFCKN